MHFSHDFCPFTEEKCRQNGSIKKQYSEVMLYADTVKCPETETADCQKACV